MNRDEKEAAALLERKDIDCIVVVYDISRLERNLYLTLRIMELHENAIICLNFIDEAQRRDVLSTNKLAAISNEPVVECSARSQVGLVRLADTAITQAQNTDHAPPLRFVFDESVTEDERIEAFNALSGNIIGRCPLKSRSR